MAPPLPLPYYQHQQRVLHDGGSTKPKVITSNNDLCGCCDSSDAHFALVSFSPLLVQSFSHLHPTNDFISNNKFDVDDWVVAKSVMKWDHEPSKERGVWWAGGGRRIVPSICCSRYIPASLPFPLEPLNYLVSAQKFILRTSEGGRRMLRKRRDLWMCVANGSWTKPEAMPRTTVMLSL